MSDVPKVIRAEAFHLVAPDGTLRARLAVDDGVAALGLFDKDGALLATLGLLPDGRAGLTLYDKDDNARAVLGVKSDGTPGLVLFDAHGRAGWEAPR